ncbi:tRNA 2'-phosphotransferase 1 [Glycine soja]
MKVPAVVDGRFKLFERHRFCAMAEERQVIGVHTGDAWKGNSRMQKTPKNCTGRGKTFDMRNDRERTTGCGGGSGSGKDKIDSLSRLLTRILRHMAYELNLNMRSDGYVKVNDLLKLNLKTFANIPLRSHTIDHIREAVRKDNKQRFSLLEENGELLIRANQGHTVKVVETESLLKPILSAEEFPGATPTLSLIASFLILSCRVLPHIHRNILISATPTLFSCWLLTAQHSVPYKIAVCVHGTYRKNLESILGSGLKRMKRLHVHFSCGLPTDGEVISGMRQDVNVLIFLDVRKALEESMKLYISDNKVILTEGFDGVVSPKYFERIESWPSRQPISF